MLPLSAEIAADLLTSRFASPHSTGICEVAQDCLLYPAAAEELSSLLAAIPDRAATTTVVLLHHQSKDTNCYAALQPQAFIPFLVSALIGWCCVDGSTTSTTTTFMENNNSKTKVAADVLCRVVQRGYAPLTAAALLLESQNNSPSTTVVIIASLFHAFPASPAVEKLLEAVIRRLPAATSPENNNTTNNKNTYTLLQSMLPFSTVWSNRSDVRHCLQDKLLTQRVLPTPSLLHLLHYLDSISTSPDDDNDDGDDDVDTARTDDVLAGAAHRIACVWSDKAVGVHSVPAPQQAYMTAALSECLLLLGRHRFESYPGLMAAVLHGISVRLDSPLSGVRRQAMRVGSAMSRVLGGGGGCSVEGGEVLLFGDQDLSLLKEERWEEGENEGVGLKEKRKKNTVGKTTTTTTSSTKKKKKKEKKSTAEERRNGTAPDYPLTETDSDDDGDGDDGEQESSSDSEFEQFDVDSGDESDEEDVAKSNLQLRDVITMIQKSDSDWKAHLQALTSAESLIRAAPDELVHYAVPLARALLLTKVPPWANEEQRQKSEDSIEEQRFRSLVAITAASPESVGLELAAELYSPSLDMQQRARALAVMASAAEEISSPGSYLKPLPGITTSGTTNTLNLESSSGNNERRAGRVVRASTRSLAAALQNTTSHHKTQQPQANHFPPIALKWTVALLRECDVRRHGVDLFGRDHFLLGCLLSTLGNFLEASQHSVEAVPLTLAVVELIRGHHVHDSEEPFVRRAALMAASHAVMAIPPSAIATAMLPVNSHSIINTNNSNSNQQSVALVERLEWLREWAEKTAESDVDENCRLMAAGCRGLYGVLSSEALTSLAESAAASSSSFLLGQGAPVLPDGGTLAANTIKLPPQFDTLSLTK